MTSAGKSLPTGWALAEGADLFEFIRGVSYKKVDAHQNGTQDSVAILRAGNLQDGQILLDDLVYIPSKYVHQAQRICKGDLVVAMSSGSASVVGKVAVALEDLPRVAFGAFCGLMRPRAAVLQHWLSQYFQTGAYRHQISQLAAGVNINNLRGEHLLEQQIPVPPLHELHRLHSRIDALQAHSRKARESLAEIGPLLSQFRQNLLSAAFRGDLTADWRAANPNTEPATELLARIRQDRRRKWEEAELAKYEAKGKKRPGAFQDDDTAATDESDTALETLKSLPQGWSWTRVADICFIQGGFAFKSQDYTDAGIPLIRIGDLHDGAVTISSATVRLPEILADRHAQFRLNYGDILIAMSGATTGKTAVFELDHVALLNQRVGRFLPHAPELIHGPYLRYLVENLVEDIRGRAYGGAQPNISPTEIAATAVALPPLAEQIRIAELLTAIWDAAVAVEKVVGASESALNHLDQSILAKAFRGDLVPQDPRDEPASVLLERIRKTRTEGPPSRAKRGATGKRKPASHSSVPEE